MEIINIPESDNRWFYMEIVFPEIEEWKIYSYNGIETDYYISNFGRVFSKNKNKLLSNRYQNSGYLVVDIRIGKSKKTLTIHRMVAETFVDGKTNECNIVNHKDGRKNNPVFTNLEWVTYTDNILHAYKNNLRHSGFDCNFGKFSDEIIEEICKDMSTGMYTLIEISEKYNIEYHTIYAIHSKKIRKDISDKFDIANCKLSRQRTSIPNNIKEKIYSLYDEGVGTKDIQQKLEIEFNFQIKKKSLTEIIRLYKKNKIQ